MDDFLPFATAKLDESQTVEMATVLWGMTLRGFVIPPSSSGMVTDRQIYFMVSCKLIN